MKMKWKCNVCGEVFDYLPEICPVCGAKKTAFSRYEVQPINYQKDTNENFVIAGGGIAALETAKAIRARNKTASITMIFSENKLPYNRPALSDLICKELSFADIVLENYNFYKDNNINLIKNTEVLDINKEEKSVILSNGKEILYDKLCLATGANAFCPFETSEDKLPIKTLRTYQDALNLLDLLKNKGNKIIIAGGGILGIEAAVAFNNRGAKVTLIERNSFIVRAQLDEYASTNLKKVMQDNGISVHTNATIKEIKNDGVILDNGEFVEADFILASMGVRSNLTLAKKCGLKTDRAIIVDNSMKTSHENIYAVGDCAECNGSPGGLWIISSAQGKIAGANMAGDKVVYKTVPFATAFEGFNQSFFSVGNINNNIEKSQIYEQNGVYKKLTFIDNTLAGVLLWNDTSLSNEAMEFIANKAPIDKAIKLLND